MLVPQSLQEMVAQTFCNRHLEMALLVRVSDTIDKLSEWVNRLPSKGSTHVS